MVQKPSNLLIGGNNRSKKGKNFRKRDGNANLRVFKMRNTPSLINSPTQVSFVSVIWAKKEVLKTVVSDKRIVTFFKQAKEQICIIVLLMIGKVEVHACYVIFSRHQTFFIECKKTAINAGKPRSFCRRQKNLEKLSTIKSKDISKTQINESKITDPMLISPVTFSINEEWF